MTPQISKQVFRSDEREMFTNYLRALAAAPGLGVLANRYPWQARLAADALLDLACKRKAPVRILSGAAHEGFYDANFTLRLANCRKSGVPSIQVLVWQKTQDGISKQLLKLADDGVIDLKVSGTDEYADRVPHFLLVGNDAFRQEAAHAPFTEKTLVTDTEPQVPARIDFSDPDTGRSLAQIFKQLWGKDA